MHPEFHLDEELIHLNNAAVAPWPRRTLQAITAFSEENIRYSSKYFMQWLNVERELRTRLKHLLNAESADDIALVKNTSEGLSFVAYGLQWQTGENVVSSNQEFPSNRIVWESLAAKGVEFRQVDVSGLDPESSLIAAIDEHTRLLTISSVQFATGLRLDLQRLGEACRERGVLFCVDAIQSLGAICFDALACHADFVVADGHKWMLAPEGLGVFYSSSQAREQLSLTQYGWHMVERKGDFDRTDWEISKNASRFEPGSPNMLGIHALNASLSLLEEEGMEKVEARVLACVRVLMRAIGESPVLELITPESEGRFAGIVTFRHRNLDAADLHRYFQKRGVLCVQRFGGVRFSPHFYLSESQLGRVVKMISELT